MLFQYLDTDNNGEISFEEFRQLDEENWRKIDPNRIFEMTQTSKLDGDDQTSVGKSTSNGPKQVRNMSISELDTEAKLKVRQRARNHKKLNNHVIFRTVIQDDEKSTTSKKSHSSFFKKSSNNYDYTKLYGHFSNMV